MTQNTKAVSTASGVVIQSNAQMLIEFDLSHLLGRHVYTTFVRRLPLLNLVQSTERIVLYIDGTIRTTEVNQIARSLAPLLPCVLREIALS